MNKEILLSLIIISTVAALVSGVTFAFFRDTETSSGNTFTAGTLDLKIKDGDQSWSDGITTAEWEMTDMKPGDGPEYGSICFKNVGSIEADHLEITCDYTIDENDCLEQETNCANSPDDMAYYMEITEMTYYYDGNSIDCLPLISDTNGNGYKDLQDLKVSGVDNLPPPNDVGDEKVDIYIKFREEAGNDFQGDTFKLTMIFTLNQDSSQ